MKTKWFRLLTILLIIPMIFVGCTGSGGDGKETEETEINALSYLFLDVYDKMALYNPKIQIKVAKSTPKRTMAPSKCARWIIYWVGS